MGEVMLMPEQDLQGVRRRLLGLVEFKLRFTTKTGLLIRMPVHAQVYRIGGADQYPMVIRMFYRSTGVELEVPYVPGSSIKGRMRSLLELATNQKLYTTDDKIWMHMRSLSAMNIDEFLDDVFERNVISELMGWASAYYKQVVEKMEKDGSEKYDEESVKEVYKYYLATTRLSFTDFFPSENYVKKIGATSISDFLEEKPENRIDRITATADPREIVRVRPGVEFEGTATLLVFDIDKDYVKRNVEMILLGLELLEKTYLGGSGSRGYGRIEFLGDRVEVYKITVDEKQGVAKLVLLGDPVTFRSLKELREKSDQVVHSIKGLFQEV
jgi:CRISPR-associated protein Csm3